MFVLVDKRNKKMYLSKSKVEIANKSGINYHSLCYYSKKEYYENLDLIFGKTEIIKSKQGGNRGHNFKKKNNE